MDSTPHKIIKKLNTSMSVESESSKLIQSSPIYGTPYSLSLAMDSFLLRTIAQSYILSSVSYNRPSNAKNQGLVDCSTATSPCPEGCQEVPDCLKGLSISCGYFTNLLQLSTSEIKIKYLCSCTCTAAASSTNDAPAVRNELMNLYNSTRGNDWYISTNWNNPKISYCSYFGVYCDISFKVFALGADNNNMVGIIPPSLVSLQALDKIWYSNNLLSGSIPPLIAQLRKLESLLLYGNGLEGM